MMRTLFMADRMKGEAVGFFFFGYVLLQIPGGYWAMAWKPPCSGMGPHWSRPGPFSSGRQLRLAAAQALEQPPSRGAAGQSACSGKKEGGLQAPLLASREIFNQRLKWKP